MPTDKQKDASRRNGAKSRGPATDAGKQRSSQNSLRHGICSRALLIAGESQEDLEAHFAAYRERFQPADPVEADLVDNLAFITWRQHRLWRREADIIREQTLEDFKLTQDANRNRRCASQAWACLPDSVVTLLHREEASLRRAFDRTLKNLRELQATRPEPPPSGPNTDGDAKLRNEPETGLTSYLTTAEQPKAPAPNSPSGISYRTVLLAGSASPEHGRT